MSRYNKIRVACALALSVALILSGMSSVGGWGTFHNDKFRTGHIETSVTNITTNISYDSLMDPEHYAASPVAAPSYAYYTSNNDTWWYGDWRVVATGDHCVVAYDEDLEKQWTFYTPQRVVATPTICVLTEWNPTGDDDEIEGERAAVIITEGESGGSWRNWPMIYVVDLIRLAKPVVPRLVDGGFAHDLVGRYNALRCVLAHRPGHGWVREGEDGDDRQRHHAGDDEEVPAPGPRVHGHGMRRPCL